MKGVHDELIELLLEYSRKKRKIDRTERWEIPYSLSEVVTENTMPSYFYFEEPGPFQTDAYNIPDPYCPVSTLIVCITW